MEARRVVDKFTGDGFLSYWPYDQRSQFRVVSSVITMASELRVEFQERFIPQFASNSQNFLEDVGLAIGLDSGAAKVVAIADDPTIVGPAVVGAVRMVSEARVWAVLVNVHLGEYIREHIDRFPDVDIAPIPIKTKEYESQLAYILDVGSSESRS